MEELFAMIAKALAFRRFDIRLENGYSAIASLFTNEGEAFFQQMLASGSTHVSGDLGAGTFTYEGAQAKDDPQLTMWRFRIYGGVDFGGDPNVYGASSLAIAVTGRPELIGNLFYSSFLKDRNAPKVGRNEPCPCGSGKKHKRCHGSVVKVEARERMLAHAAARRVVPSTYQPIAAHGYGRIGRRDGPLRRTNAICPMIFACDRVRKSVFCRVRFWSSIPSDLIP